MSEASLRPGDAVTLELPALDGLVGALKGRGWSVYGPVVRDGAVVLGEVTTAADLARGVADEQEAGRYRLLPAADSLFGFTHGPDTWKRVLLPPALPLTTLKRNGASFSEAEPPPRSAPLALFGVRACDLAAIHVLDRVFLAGPCIDVAWAARREEAFLVVLACTRAGGTCFCASTGSGPRPDGPFDVRLTELPGSPPHRVLAEAGSARGADLLGSVPHGAASEADGAAAENAVARAAGAQRRALPADGLAEWLLGSYENPHWDDVARRCLACGNCTLVCPTCFCTTVEEGTSLDGGTARRVRRWDSCFTPDFSYIHGGSVRPSVRARYRQWLTHKLATYREQFGVPGCVGCGRCITWCPAGIDLTEEVRALHRSARPKEDRHGRDA